MLRVFYRCPRCGNEWDEVYECACDSECECGLENIQALSYEEIEDEDEDEDEEDGS